MMYLVAKDAGKENVLGLRVGNLLAQRGLLRRCTGVSLARCIVADLPPLRLLSRPLCRHE